MSAVDAFLAFAVDWILVVAHVLAVPWSNCLEASPTADCSLPGGEDQHVAALRTA